ncbi:MULTISPECIES: sporulation initiation phosphotransferase B [Bacillus]|uniref:Sporulation protein n=2 Tax=Bacillus TaxID=1386 RepID=A0A0M5JBM5_9BACI|nr:MULTISPECIES: sporulation initiation phosphotransferase B [Bacillus]ALC81844.1 sporulation protein [Bacillus gobiensis]MBP1083154.1 stage 0 sporulation protein B (sporulation initiation phosphotransferase) [Bacillus capparidis]MED1097595.1 sporulation initiation phosphotransferase B [Bacillus capparidis]
MKELTNQAENHTDQTVLSKELLHLLGHSRHDWMNKLQLIKGNLSLQKYERVFEIIEEMAIEAQHESKLSSMKVPHLAYDLVTFNWKSKYITLEYEILGSVKDLSYFDDKLVYVVRKLLHLFEQAVSKESENHLTLTLQTDSPDDVLILYFDFHGLLQNKEVFDNIHTADRSFYHINRFKISDKECLAELYLQ